MQLKRWIKPSNLCVILISTAVFAAGCVNGIALPTKIEYIPCSQLPGPFLYRDMDHENTLKWGDDYNVVWEVLCGDEPS